MRVDRRRAQYRLGDYSDRYALVDASPSAELIRISSSKLPLHDGAMVIRDGRVHAAGAFAAVQ